MTSGNRVGIGRGDSEVTTGTHAPGVTGPSQSAQTPQRPAAIFTRVTIVAPQTRIDVALPADVAIADLLPMVLNMARETTPDGGSRHGGWCLAKLGDTAIDPSRTLGSIGVVDGDLLQLRRRSENPPPPLFDDIVEAVAASAPDSFRPWTPATARVLGQITAVLAMVASAVALLLAGPGLAPGLIATGTAIAAVAAGAVIARVYNDLTTGILVATGGLPIGLVAGSYLVPGAQVEPSLLLGCVMVLVLAGASILVIGCGITTFIAAATAATIGALAFLIATLIDYSAAGIAAGAAAVALGGISVLPRFTIQMSRIPLPQVPTSAEDLQEDTDFPDYSMIERRAGVAHEYMTGMIIGSGVAAAIAAVVATGGGMFGVILGSVVAAVLLLRARSYANGSQAVALLVSGMSATLGLFVIWLLAASPTVLMIGVFGGLVTIAAASLMLGVVIPGRRFSPVLRRTVDIVEALLIASVLPLALAVMDLYSTLRHL